jgi:chemotaxis protein methyltransferase CheR
MRQALDNGQAINREIILQPDEFERFRKLIYERAGIALTPAKMQLVQSRLRKRVVAYKLDSFRAYYDLLVEQGENGPEMGNFVNCITTNKTDFFREPHHFKFVTERVIPEAVQRARQQGAGQNLRIWHAGCSTGEEPYTLAITLAQALDGRGAWNWRQLASDIDTNVLAHAERGIYEEDRLNPVPEPLRRKYFLRGAGPQQGYYKVKQSLRDHITFRQINLLAPEWPIRQDLRFDMIFCRNVVIYFDKPTQRTLFARYERLLKPGGYLFIGHSESLLGISDSFENLGHTIYRLPETQVREHVATKAIAA